MAVKNRDLPVLFVVAIASLLRIVEALRFPYEQDEIYTIDEATNLFHTHLLPGIQARPVFFLLEHPLVVSLPRGAAFLRLLPLIFGILGLWTTWLLARDVLGRRGGLVAVVLVSLCPWHLYASGFARYYSLLYLLAALVYWRLPLAYDSDRAVDYVWALVPLLIGSWTHPSFIFPVVGAVIAVSIVGPDGQIGWRWPTRRSWAYLWLPFGLISAAGLVAVILLHPRSNVANGADRGLLATLRLVPAMVDWTTVPLAATTTAGIALLLREQDRRLRRLGLMALIGIASMLLALFALSFRTSIYADYGVSALPLAIVAAAAAIEWIARQVAERQRSVAAAAVLGIIAAAMLPSVVSHLSDGTRFDYRPAFARIRATSPGTPVLTWPIALQREYAPALNATEIPTSYAALDSALHRYGDLWAVTSVKRFGIAEDDNGEMARWLGDHCRPVEQFQRPRLDYRMYRVDLWRCRAGT